MTHPAALAQWHHLVQTHDSAGLWALLAEDAVFHSPVVHTPQVGRPIVSAYLTAAFQVFFNDSFRYVRETVADDHAVLEFSVTLDGIEVNGVDIISWNADGRITQFKVMLRPLKAVNLIHQRMGEMLAARKGG